MFFVEGSAEPINDLEEGISRGWFFLRVKLLFLDSFEKSKVNQILMIEQSS
jgi:hypothetical protein